MAKLNITVTKDFGISKAKETEKRSVYDVIQAALIAEYGEDSAFYVREISPTTGKGENHLCVLCADISEDGGVFDGPLTIKVTAKEWCERVGTKSVKPAFDFDSARAEYEKWVVESAEKAEKKAAEKAAKIAADNAARAKRKAEADAKKAAANQ